MGDGGRYSRCVVLPVTRHPSPPSVLDGITTLIDQSLLGRVDTGVGDPAEPRFAMLETIREFGLEALGASGEEAVVRRAHATWCIDLTERAHAAFVAGEPESPWLDRLEAEHDNCRAALGWLESRGDVEGLLRLCSCLGWFWTFRSHRTEGRDWLERGLALAGNSARPTDRARALHVLATFGFSRGDYEHARALAEESLALCRTLGDTWGGAVALNLLGAIARGRGDLDAAPPLLERAIELFRSLADEGRLALAICNLGILSHWRGDAVRATALLEEALALYKRRDDPWGATVAASDLGLVMLERGDGRRAAALLAESHARWQTV